MAEAAPARAAAEIDNPAPAIPYRDSKLTWLLRDALGGGVAEAGDHIQTFAENRHGGMRTTVLACCATEPGALPATMNTLRFAQRCRHASVWSVLSNDEDDLYGDGPASE